MASPLETYMKSLFVLASLLMAGNSFAMDISHALYRPEAYRLVKAQGACPAKITAQVSNLNFSLPEFGIEADRRNDMVQITNWGGSAYLNLFGYDKTPLDGRTFYHYRRLGEMDCSETGFNCQARARVSKSRSALISFSADFNKMTIDEKISDYISGFFQNEQLGSSTRRCSYRIVNPIRQ